MATIEIKKAPRQLKLEPQQWGIEWDWVDVEDIRFDRLAYQRNFSERRADAIANAFNPHKFDPIRVNVRPDGTKWVVDGQHRVIAARKVGIRWVPGILQRDAEVRDEANQFISVNTSRTRPDPVTLFKASKTAGDPNALDVQRILDETGWTLLPFGRNTKTAAVGTFSSPATATMLYKRYGSEQLQQALYVLRTTWPEDRAAANSQLVSGMTRLLFKFGDVIKIAKLVDKLSTVTPTQLISQAKQLSTALPGSGGYKIDEAIAQVLFAQYQKSKRGKRWDWNARSIVLERPSGKALRRDHATVRPERKEEVVDAPTATEETAGEPEAPANSVADSGDAVEQLIRSAVNSTK